MLELEILLRSSSRAVQKQTAAGQQLERKSERKGEKPTHLTGPTHRWSVPTKSLQTTEAAWCFLGFRGREKGKWGVSMDKTKPYSFKIEDTIVCV